jgi:hypothetical protein
MGRQFVLLVLVVMLLGGCTSGPDWAGIEKEKHIVKWTRVKLAYTSTREFKDATAIAMDYSLVTVTLKLADVIAVLEASPTKSNLDLATELQNKCNEPRTYAAAEFTNRQEHLLGILDQRLMDKGKCLVQINETHKAVREIVIGTSTTSSAGSTHYYLPDGRSLGMRLDWY